MISELIDRIRSLQSKGDRYFASGLFPSFRENVFWRYRRPDDNIFATLSVCFVLDELSPFLNGDQQIIISSIKKKAIRCLPKYQMNPEGLTFNFYPSGSDKHFPNGFFMHRFHHFKLPDDIDDTALAYLIQEADLLPIRDLLVRHANADGVYDTWFGKNMPKEKDVCALANLMYLILKAGKELNSNDQKTLIYLNEVIASGEYLNNPFWVARHYGTVPLIVYNYSRLIEKFDPPQLAEAREELQNRLPHLLREESVYMNQLLLQTAGFRLGLHLPLPEVREEGSFYSFIGAPFAPLSTPWLKCLASKKWAWMGWKCEAHELTILLENEVLSKSLSKKA